MLERPRDPRIKPAPSGGRGGTNLILSLGVAILAAMGGTPATAQDALTTRQMTGLKAPEANRTIRRDLLSVFEPIDGISSGMLLRLRGVSLDTRPYGTEFTGLCQKDTLSLKYAPTDLAPKPRDQPLQPYGVEVRASFHATRLPTRRPKEAGLRADVWSEDCDRLTGNKDDLWFQAKDAEEAAKAANLLQAAIDQVRAGSLKPRPCGAVPTNKRSCEQSILDEGRIEKIIEVDACPAEPDAECYIIDVGPATRLTIVGRLGDDGLAPAAVESIAVEWYVVVT